MTLPTFFKFKSGSRWYVTKCVFRVQNKESGNPACNVGCCARWSGWVAAGATYCTLYITDVWPTLSPCLIHVVRVTYCIILSGRLQQNIMVQYVRRLALHGGCGQYCTVPTGVVEEMTKYYLSTIHRIYESYSFSIINLFSFTCLLHGEDIQIVTTVESCGRWWC